MRHKIIVRDATRRGTVPQLDPRDVRDAVSFTLDAEGVGFRCEVSVTVTDDAGIRAVNREHRKIDAPTDVLSFPMQDFSPGQYGGAEYDMASGRVPLGDIVLSAERVARQAREYGGTTGRETAYLTAHSVLHLLGYDHTDEGADKRLMREREKSVMRSLGYGDGDEEI